MRLPTFFLLLLGGAGCVGTGWFVWKATANTREWRELLNLSERRPTGLSKAEESRFQELGRRRVPLESPRRSIAWVASLEGEGASRRLVLVTEPREIQQSGDTLFQIHVFDHNYRLIGSTPASPGVGHRTLRFGKGSRTDLGPYPFEVECALPNATRRFVSRHRMKLEQVTQHYILIQDQPVLVRVEDLSGALVPMEYEDRDRMLGPGLPDRTPQAWEESLSLPMVGEVLQTLMWLGGRHGPRRRSTVDRNDADHFDDVRRRPGVAQKVAELTRSPHPWVAEAANAVRLDGR